VTVELGTISHVSNRLVRAANEGSIPSSLHQVTSTEDLFNSLATVSQLLLRHRGGRLWEYLHSFLLLGTNQSEKKFNEIELLPLPLRERVVVASYWLLEDWPSRFVDASKSAGISRLDFQSTKYERPKWFEEAIHESLTFKRRNQISPTEVQMSIHALRDENKGVTKLAVKKILGVSESKEIDAALSLRRIARVDELLIICRKFESRLLIVKNERDQRMTLLRDYLIFLMSVLFNAPTEEICALTICDVDQRMSDFKIIHNRETIASMLGTRVEQLKVEYLLIVGRKFGDATVKPNLLYLSRTGNQLAGHTVRERISSMMRTGFSLDLWHSVDVFNGIL
jgi:hypothetical protein